MMIQLVSLEQCIRPQPLWITRTRQSASDSVHSSALMHSAKSAPPLKQSAQLLTAACAQLSWSVQQLSYSTLKPSDNLLCDEFLQLAQAIAAVCPSEVEQAAAFAVLHVGGACVM